MRVTLVCFAVVMMLAGCAKAPSGSVSGAFTEDTKPAVFTDVTVHPLLVDGKQIYVDDQPAMALVFTAQPQGGDLHADTGALDGQYGDALVVQTSGSNVSGAQVQIAGQAGSLSSDKPLILKNYSATGGQISGELTTGGPVDASGHKLNVDLTFHAKAP